MKTYKVTDPNGFHFGGERIETGGTFTAPASSALISTALHFNQVELVEAPPVEAESQDHEPDSKAESQEPDVKGKAKK